MTPSSDFSQAHTTLLKELEDLNTQQAKLKKDILDKENAIKDLLTANAIFKPGDNVDIRKWDDEWHVGYARLLRQELNGEWVWEMRYPGHDGCCWAYAAKQENIRLTHKN